METLSIENNREDLSLNTKNHRHEFEERDNFIVCKICQKKRLKLENTDKEGLLVGRLSDGRAYIVRADRRRYFFPQEWKKFMAVITNKRHRFFFVTCLHTGARIMEVLNIRHKDIDVERGTVKINVVKKRVAKKGFKSFSKSRDFFVASNFIKEYKSFIRGKKINPEHYLFLNNEELPENYEELTNAEKKKYYQKKSVAYSRLLKNKLKKAGIEDYYNFSPHNIRKTYGMWMRTFNIEMAELTYRMGHDLDTFIAHYGSSLIFTDVERREIQKIMGDVK